MNGDDRSGVFPSFPEHRIHEILDVLDQRVSILTRQSALRADRTPPIDGVPSGREYNGENTPEEEIKGFPPIRPIREGDLPLSLIDTVRAAEEVSGARCRYEDPSLYAASPLGAWYKTAKLAKDPLDTAEVDTAVEMSMHRWFAHQMMVILRDYTYNAFRRYAKDECLLSLVSEKIRFKIAHAIPPTLAVVKFTSSAPFPTWINLSSESDMYFNIHYRTKVMNVSLDNIAARGVMVARASQWIDLLMNVRDVRILRAHQEGEASECYALTRSVKSLSCDNLRIIELMRWTVQSRERNLVQWAADKALEYPASLCASPISLSRILMTKFPHEIVRGLRIALQRSHPITVLQGLPDEDAMQNLAGAIMRKASHKVKFLIVSASPMVLWQMLARMSGRRCLLLTHPQVTPFMYHSLCIANMRSSCEVPKFMGMSMEARNILLGRYDGVNAVENILQDPLLQEFDLPHRYRLLHEAEITFDLTPSLFRDGLGEEMKSVDVVVVLDAYQMSETDTLGVAQCGKRCILLDDGLPRDCMDYPYEVGEGMDHEDIKQSLVQRLTDREDGSIVTLAPPSYLPSHLRGVIEANCRVKPTLRTTAERDAKGEVLTSYGQLVWFQTTKGRLDAASATQPHIFWSEKYHYNNYEASMVVGLIERLYANCNEEPGGTYAIVSVHDRQREVLCTLIEHSTTVSPFYFSQKLIICHPDALRNLPPMDTIVVSTVVCSNRPSTHYDWSKPPLEKSVAEVARRHTANLTGVDTDLAKTVRRMTPPELLLCISHTKRQCLIVGDRATSVAYSPGLCKILKECAWATIGTSASPTSTVRSTTPHEIYIYDAAAPFPTWRNEFTRLGGLTLLPTFSNLTATIKLPDESPQSWADFLTGVHVNSRAHFPRCPTKIEFPDSLWTLYLPQPLRLLDTLVDGRSVAIPESTSFTAVCKTRASLTGLFKPKPDAKTTAMNANSDQKTALQQQHERATEGSSNAPPITPNFGVPSTMNGPTLPSAHPHGGSRVLPTEAEHTKEPKASWPRQDINVVPLGSLRPFTVLVRCARPPQSSATPVVNEAVPLEPVNNDLPGTKVDTVESVGTFSMDRNLSSGLPGEEDVRPPPSAFREGQSTSAVYTTSASSVLLRNRWLPHLQQPDGELHPALGSPPVIRPPLADAECDR